MPINYFDLFCQTTFCFLYILLLFSTHNSVYSFVYSIRHSETNKHHNNGSLQIPNDWSTRKNANETFDIETKLLHTNATEKQDQDSQNAYYLAKKIFTNLIYKKPIFSLPPIATQHSNIVFTKEVPIDINQLPNNISGINGHQDVVVQDQDKLLIEHNQNLLLNEVENLLYPNEQQETTTEIDKSTSYSTLEKVDYEDEDVYEPDELEDDEELASYRYPVRVSFSDEPEEYPETSISNPEVSSPFEESTFPTIDLSPESLKQKGCKTIVKEIKSVPVEQLPQTNQLGNDKSTRTKRSIDGRKFTTIVMTKECHFPNEQEEKEEKEKKEEKDPQKTPVKETKVVSDTKQDNTYELHPRLKPSYDDEKQDNTYELRPRLKPRYDPDFDFEPSFNYHPSLGIKSKKRKFINSNLQEDDFDFENIFSPSEDHYDNSRYYDSYPKVKKHNKERNQRRRRYHSPSKYSSSSEGYREKPRERHQLYNDNRSNNHNNNHRHSKRGPIRRKPKKVNRSFAFYRKNEPKEKDPYNDDYSVSYGRGSFQSYSEDYDSDRDGPRPSRPSRQRKESRKRW